MWLAHIRAICIMHCPLRGQLEMPSRCWRPEQPRRQMSLPKGRWIPIALRKAIVRLDSALFRLWLRLHEERRFA